MKLEGFYQKIKEDILMSLSDRIRNLEEKTLKKKADEYFSKHADDGHIEEVIEKLVAKRCSQMQLDTLVSHTVRREIKNMLDAKLDIRWDGNKDMPCPQHSTGVGPCYCEAKEEQREEKEEKET